jgi:hypothetical protein
VISCTLRIIINLMETIKDPYQTAVTAWAKSAGFSLVKPARQRGAVSYR